MKLFCSTIFFVFVLPVGEVCAKAEEVSSSLLSIRKLYQQGELQQVITQVNELLPSITKSSGFRDAYLLIGACVYLRGLQKEAALYVIKGFSYDPNYKPDPLFFSPDVLEFFKQIVKDHKSEIQTIATQRLLKEKPNENFPKDSNKTQTGQITSKQTQSFERIIPNPIEQDRSIIQGASEEPPEQPFSAVRRHRSEQRSRMEQAESRGFGISPPTEDITPLYLAVLPFGIGQFANGHRIKGWLLLGVETALIATSVASFASAFSLEDENGKYFQEDIKTARALNTTYLVTGYAALAMIVYGAVDGIIYRRHTKQVLHTVWITPSINGEAGLQTYWQF